MNQSQCIQLLGSNPEKPHLLKYLATEDEWNEYLLKSGLHDPTPRKGPLPVPQPALSTKGAPDDWKGPRRQTSRGGDHQKYAIISIMGPQSSGKSTILNELFGTNFDVMDHTKGRHQVTTGIWIGSCPKARDLMVLDLEGTDSAERKQNRSNFERQTSLMALTLSEVLIINMWATDIGRSTGMNVDTLRAILSANLRLFAPDSKTLLLFLIREQSPDESQFGVTPSAQLRETVQRVLMTIWTEIDKPDGFGDTKLSDLFDIDFFFLPPLVYFKELFDRRCRELYGRFTRSSDPHYYFNNSYHFKKCVPPEGLWTWTSQIFQAITKDESLNIPDQQKLLSAYRCEHALNAAFAAFTNGIAEVSAEVEARWVPRFGARLDAVIGAVMAQYKETASKYDEEEAMEKYKSLVDRIETQIQFLFNAQYKWLEAKVLDVFQLEMDRALPRGECVPDLNAVVNRAADCAKKVFSDQMAECAVKTENAAVVDRAKYWNETQQRLRERTKSIQLEQWQSLQKENESLADEHLLAAINKLLAAPTPTLWHDVSSLRVVYHGRFLREHIMAKLQRLMYDEQKLKEKALAIRNASDSLIVDRCKKYCLRMDLVLQELFDGAFNKCPESGVPRKWDETVPLDEVFVAAKDRALSILKLCGQIALDENLDLGLQPIKLRLLSSSDLEEMKRSFSKFADDEYRRAQRDIQFSNTLGGGILPTHPVTWAVFLFFAKDEIWSMLTNPLYLITVIVLVIGAAIAYQAHVYGFDVQTIVMQMATKGAQIAMAKLEEFQRKQMEIQRKGQRNSRPPPMNPTDDDLDEGDDRNATTTTTAGR